MPLPAGDCSADNVLVAVSKTMLRRLSSLAEIDTWLGCTLRRCRTPVESPTTMNCPSRENSALCKALGSTASPTLPRAAAAAAAAVVAAPPVAAASSSPAAAWRLTSRRSTGSVSDLARFHNAT